MELVSILVPIHNEAQYICECIESIEAQSYQNYELIIVDDGSDDQSLTIVQHKAKLNPKIKIYTQSKLGVIKALNYALENSAGKYIARIDGDDIMPKDRLTHQVKKLKECGRQSIVTGKVEYFSNSTISQGYQEYQDWLNSLNTPQDFYQNQFVECVVAAPSMLMYKEDLESIGAYDEEVYPEDFNLILKALANNFSIHSIPYKVLDWRDHSHRSSKTLAYYERDRFWDLRARYLIQFIERHKIDKKISIFGAGANGKYLLQAMEKYLIPCQTFYDIEINRVGGSYRGVKVSHIEEFNETSQEYILVALREKNAKQSIIKFMTKLNRNCIEDYIFMC